MGSCQRDKIRVHFASLMDICHKNAELEPKLQKYVQRQSRAQRRHCKGRFRSLRSLHRTRLICVTDDCCKNHGCYRKIVDDIKMAGKKEKMAPSLMDICHLENAELEAKLQMYRILCSIYRTRIMSITNDSRKKSWTLYQDHQDAQDKQLTQYPLIRRSKWKMHQRY